MNLPEAIVKATEIVARAQIEINDRVIWQVLAIFGGLALLVVVTLAAIAIGAKLIERI